jgi:sulfur carrier protein
MRITLNGTDKALPAGVTLAALMEGEGHDEDAPVAAAVNGAFVPRGRWADTVLVDGDAVEIVAPMQGG